MRSLRRWCYTLYRGKTKIVQYAESSVDLQLTALS